jgi:hypothetical protein
MNTLDQADPRLIYAMFKGEPGTRKSTCALSFPSPQYWFSWDQKMNGILIPAKQWNIDVKKIHYDDYSDWNAAKAKLEAFQLNCDYQTLVFDSLTSCADMTLRQTLKLKAGVTRQSGAKAGKLIAGISINEIEDYAAESSALQELIALTKDIQKYQKSRGKFLNIILIAHVVQAEYRNTTTGETHISRTIVTAGKKVAPKIPAYCSEVYHFNIKKGFEADAGGKYALLTQHTGDDFARTALPLDKEIIFEDRPLYQDYILPAIEKMLPPKQTNQTQQTTTKNFGV